MIVALKLTHLSNIDKPFKSLDIFKTNEGLKEYYDKNKSENNEIKFKVIEFPDMLYDPNFIDTHWNSSLTIEELLCKLKS